MKKKNIILSLLVFILLLTPVVVFADGEHIGDNFCYEKNVMTALRVLGYFIIVIKLAIPLFIIGTGIFDLVKGVISGEATGVGKGVKSIGIRVLIGVVIFILPSLINATLNGLMDNENEYRVCQTCLLDPRACESGEVDEVYNPDDVFIENEE